MPSFLEQVDQQVEQTLRGWNIWTTILALILVAVVIYPIITAKDPDTHPLLLSRQSSVAPIRQEGESAAYRSIETPYGYPLKSGLNVKDEGMSKWSAGRDGDLRDIWRQVVSPVSEDGQPRSSRSKIMTVYGVEEIETHDLSELTKQINIIGQHMKQQGASTVAISLPNSVETLVALFAASFYGINAVLIPSAQSENVALSLIAMSQADFLIAEAGSIPADNLKSRCPGLKQTMWVVEKTSRHMDWTDNIGSSVWHEVVQQATTVSPDVPAHVPESVAPGVTTIWQNDKATTGEVVSFTSGNIVAAVAAQLAVLPNKARISDADVFLPADSFSSHYILVQTLASLYAGASVAINSIANRDADLKVVAASVSPTIIACSATSALKLHRDMMSEVKRSSAKGYALSSQKTALKAGYLPSIGVFGALNAPVKASLGKVAGQLRLLQIYERVHADSPPLSSHELSELRAFTGAHVIYALTAAKVAGVVAQTAYYDYRIDEKEPNGRSHFGVPLSSVEVRLRDTATHKQPEKGLPKGNIVVLGPAVFQKEAILDVNGAFKHDGTLSYI